MIGSKKLKYFLSSNGSEGSDGWNSSKSDGPDLFWINLDDIDEENPVIVRDAKAGAEHHE